jgi:hypothetical protein
MVDGNGFVDVCGLNCKIFFQEDMSISDMSTGWRFQISTRNVGVDQQ